MSPIKKKMIKTWRQPDLDENPWDYNPKPLPTKEELYRLLYKLIDDSDYLSVEHYSMSRTAKRYLYQSTDRKDFDALKNSLVLRSARTNYSGGWISRIPSPIIFLHKGDEILGGITCNDYISVGFSDYGDILIKDRKKLKNWFRERHILSREEAEKWGTARWEINKDRSNNSLIKLLRRIVKGLLG